MDDAAFEAEQERIRALMDRWWGRDFDILRGWKVKVIYQRHQGEQRDVSGEPWYCAASCSADWRYLDATITVYCQTTATLDDEELEETFVHECCHVLTNEMREEGVEHEERVCTTVARALLDAREQGRQAAALGPFEVYD